MCMNFHSSSNLRSPKNNCVSTFGSFGWTRNALGQSHINSSDFRWFTMCVCVSVIFGPSAQTWTQARCCFCYAFCKQLLPQASSTGVGKSQEIGTPKRVPLWFVSGQKQGYTSGWGVPALAGRLGVCDCSLLSTSWSATTFFRLCASAIKQSLLEVVDSWSLDVSCIPNAPKKAKPLERTAVNHHFP